MRRFLFGIAIASLTASVPSVVLGGDQEIADAIVTTLNQQQATGSLKGFDIDIGVESGKVILTGRVSNQDQLKSVLDAANSVSGVQEVVSKIEVKGQAPKPVKETGKTFSLREAIANPDYAAGFLGRGSHAQNPLTGSLEAPSSVSPASTTEPSQRDILSEPARLPSDNTSVSPQDAAITDQIIGRIAAEQKSGRLRLFEVEVSTVRGEVWVRGYTANAFQKDLILRSIQHTAGVVQIIDDIAVKGNDGVRPAAAQQQESSMPIASSQGQMAPRPFAQSMLASQATDPYCPPGAVAQGPVPMQGAMTSYGPGVLRYDSPTMPNYAWPSYAAYPNYAAVTYPKQYSATAWPYIGPFYPYPQVPLGWRRVALEWDDGMWYLDFSSKR